MEDGDEDEQLKGEWPQVGISDDGSWERRYRSLELSLDESRDQNRQQHACHFT